MENDFFKPTHPTKVWKIPYFFLKASLIIFSKKICSLKMIYLKFVLEMESILFIYTIAKVFSTLDLMQIADALKRW